MMSLSLAGPDNDLENSYGADVAAPAPFSEPEIHRCSLKRQQVTILQEGEDSCITEPWVMETITGNFYELGRILKECQFGQVNHAILLIQNEDGTFARAIPYKQFAIKIYSKARIRAKRGRSIENPENEIAAMQCLGTHPNIVQLVECTADHDNVYSIMEFCNGGELFEMIEDEGPVTENRARSLFTQIVQGLAQIHSLGLAHRDMSLENVLLITKNSTDVLEDADADSQMESGGDDWGHGNGDTAAAPSSSSEVVEICKIIDFGMCLSLPRRTEAVGDDGTFSTSGASAGAASIVKIPPQGTSGKRNYIAPEVIENMYPFNPQLSDLWAIGVILCIMLTGLCPVEVASPLDPRYRMIRAGLLKGMMEQWGMGLSAEVTDLLFRLLQAVPENRLAIEDILSHPWITMTPVAEVSTPVTRLVPFGSRLHGLEETLEEQEVSEDGDDDQGPKRHHSDDDGGDDDQEVGDGDEDYGNSDNDFDYDDNRMVTAANTRQNSERCSSSSNNLSTNNYNDTANNTAVSSTAAAADVMVITPPSPFASCSSSSSCCATGYANNNNNLLNYSLSQPSTGFGIVPASEDKCDDLAHLRYPAARSVTRDDCMKKEAADDGYGDAGMNYGDDGDGDGDMDVIYVMGQCVDSKSDKHHSCGRRMSYDGI